MKMKTSRIIAALFAVALAPLSAYAAITIDTVTVGNPGNANDGTGFGGVSYTYDIGTYEVSLVQYAAFLNAVAATDTYSLYNTNLGTNLNVAGISQSGSSGSYTYSVIGDGNRPVTYVSWFDAARFTNWLGNGQPTGAQGAGTTETGAYTLNGATSGIFTRNAGATWGIPSENEWYKAAYYDPSPNGGSGGYWLYPTRSNSVPGNIVGSSPNQANYNNGVFSVTQSGTYSSSQNYLTPKGAYSASGSAYGSFDQGGNVNEWNDAVIGSSRRYRGGSWNTNAEVYLRSSTSSGLDPTFEVDSIGFRVAAVPEPTVIGMLSVGALLLWRWKRHS
jgi:sulfatase modifying factor 1